MPRSLALAVIAVFIGCVPAASAAPVPNDTLATATPLTSLPFVTSYSLADATTEPGDATLLCGDASEHSVWYRYDATAQGILRVDATTSDGFDTGVFISEGLPPSGLAACGGGGTSLQVQPGRTYYVAVASLTANATGTVQIHAQFRPQTVFVAVDSIVNDRAAGSATFTGTITCSPDAFFGFITATLAPDTGREAGSEVQDFSCTGAPEPWTAVVTPNHGRLAGRVKVDVFAFICDDFACEQDQADSVVKLAPH